MIAVKIVRTAHFSSPHPQAYYQMQGIDHVLLFDHGTTDNSHRELAPWLKTGFVTILTNLTEMVEDMPFRKSMGKFEFIMQAKAHQEQVSK